MHVIMYIGEMTPDRYSASFTIHRNNRDTNSHLAGIELEQAYPNRLDALRALMDAMEVHMKRRYGLGTNDFTVDER